MPRWLVIAIAVVGLVVAAVVDRRMSGVESGDVREAAAKLDGVPREFGDWTSTEVPMSDKVLRVAEAAGHVSRVYANRKNGVRVGVLLLCGPTGPIGAHEPKYCYGGNGYDMSGEPQKRAIGLPDGGTAAYWSVLFEKRSGPREDPIRVCWMWGADGEWQAATDPRTEYALHRALYKLYVNRPDPPAPSGTPRFSSGTAPDPIDEFLTAFLPEVNKALAAPPGRPDVK
jgi:hypothetical protein